MSEQSTDVQTQDAEFEQNKNSSVASEQTSKGNSTGLIFLIILLFLLLGGGAIYWLYDKQQTSVKHADEKLQSYDSQISSLTSKVDEGTSKVTDAVGQQQQSTVELKASLDALANKQAIFEQTLTAIQNKKPKQQTEWVLEEAQYLLTVAQMRLNLERDMATALAAMQGADDRLRGLANPNLNPIREQLITEMNALREVEDADISGMTLYLSDVISRVDSLPLKDVQIPTMESLKNDTAAAAVEESETNTAKEVALSIWGDLIKLVEIKDQEVPDAILFDPELRYFLHQNLQLELTSAKLSILRRDSENVKASLEQVKQTLERYFDTESAAVKTIVEQLGKIQSAELKPSLPEVTQALNALMAYRQSSAEETE